MWIETELEQKLSRVEAPEELWERIQNSRTLANARGSIPGRDRKGAGVAWALVAAALLVVLVWGVPSRRDLLIQSESASQIREWVKANAGFDVPLLAGSSGVRLTSARMSGDHVEIACRVGNRDAKLLISKNKSTLSHAALSASTSTVSWGMGDRAYTLACATPEDLRIACLLCHSSSERRMALN